MAFKLILLVFSMALGLGACTNVKNSVDGMAETAENAWEGKHTLTVTIQSHRPYCGGAAPTEEQVNGFTNPLANQVFYIYKDERPSSVTKMVKVTTNDQGKFSIDLKEGTYSIISADKVLPIDEFIEKKKIDGIHYKYSDDSCFMAWRSTPEFTIDLMGAADEVVTISEKCFTGDNPCMQYTGPYPP